MSVGFVGEIRMFAGSFAPREWAFCDGQLLAVSQNDALFSILGTIYGGDGRTTFGLPDLRGRVPVHAGSGPGLTPRPLGQKAGAETVQLSAAEVAGHSHSLPVSSAAGTTTAVAGAYPAARPGGDNYAAVAPDVSMSASSVGLSAGANTPHENRHPSQTVRFIICLFGVYPSRT